MTTNMDEVRRVAKILLSTSVHVDEKFPFIVHHPFFQHTVYPARFSNGIQLLKLDDTEECAIARACVEDMIEKAKDVFDIYMLLNKPYLPTFFKLAHPYFSAEDFAKFLAEMWVCVEFPNSDVNLTTNEFAELFRKADKHILMSAEDFAAYKDLPEIVTIYRGICGDGKIKALSWSTSQKTAEWFANRWEIDGEVYAAEIEKKYIFAYFLGRGEKETVVDYAKLQNLRKL